MRPFLNLIKFIILWLCVAILPVTLTYIFGNLLAAGCSFTLVGLFLIGNSIVAERQIKKTLHPKKMEVSDLLVLTIEDPSSHAFITKSLFAGAPTIWITRGTLSLLSPDEIIALVHGMKSAERNFSLVFETILTSWMIRMTSNIPNGFQNLLFFKEKRAKVISIRDSVRGLFWISLILLLDLFYAKGRAHNIEIPEGVLRKLVAESRRCVPRLPVAFSSHSAVSPWPDAFLTLGRSCLFPPTAVN